MDFMTIKELCKSLEKLVRGGGQDISVYISGPPGIGKSAAVNQVGKRFDLPVIDLRISQFAPTDLRGLPVPRDGRTFWDPPSMYPDGGSGILFLDELTMAPPAVQGIAHQLVLDRRVGDYVLPEGWFVWAAGNRREDKSAVFEMPAALANRFIHFEVSSDIDAFRDFAVDNGDTVHAQVLAFLLFRPELLHDLNHMGARAWPSPRTWVMASRLHTMGMDISSAVGSGAAAEFQAFCRNRKAADCVEAVIGGNFGVPFPKDVSTIYSLLSALSQRISKRAEWLAVWKWLLDVSGAEWCQLFLTLNARRLVDMNLRVVVAKSIQEHPQMADLLRRNRTLLLGVEEEEEDVPF